MLHRRSEDERREILRELLRGRYQLLDTLEKIRYCAVPLMLGGFKEFGKEGMSQIGMVLGDRTKILGSHSMAGVGPGYSEVVVVLKEDWKLIVVAYNKEMRRLGKIKV